MESISLANISAHICFLFCCVCVCVCVAPSLACVGELPIIDTHVVVGAQEGSNVWDL